MTERPILMSGPMVRAILEGRKTQTRRVVRNPERLGCVTENECRSCNCEAMAEQLSPYGVLGDRLWVRETFDYDPDDDPQTRKVFYRADGDTIDPSPWRSPIHMPRWASRLTLEITEVRVERLQDISEDDAKAEGVRIPTMDGRPVLRLTGPIDPSKFCERHPKQWTLADWFRFEYATLWDSLNAKRGYGWDVNPWVWVLSFKRVDQQAVAA